MAGSTWPPLCRRSRNAQHAPASPRTTAHPQIDVLSATGHRATLLRNDMPPGNGFTALR
jgi:hypothetical protein